MIAAVSWVLLTSVVGRGAPFHLTTDEDTNPLPFAVSVNAPVPAATLAGLIDVSDGTGFELNTTVTGGLVAVRVSPLFGKSRNSYVPAVSGVVTVHVRVVTPVPTYV